MAMNLFEGLTRRLTNQWGFRPDFSDAESTLLKDLILPDGSNADAVAGAIVRYSGQPIDRAYERLQADIKLV